MDTAIRDLHASMLNEALGFPGVRRPGPTVAPFRSSVKGHSPLASEGGRFEGLMEMCADQRIPSLNVQGQNKSGYMVDIDNFNVADRADREIKMPMALDVPTPARRAELFDQIARHAERTRDWRMNPYTWELHAPEDLAVLWQAVEENLHTVSISPTS